jgi:mandelate racemase
VDLVRGDSVAPVAIAGKLRRRFDLIGVTGVARMALSALDMALWDAMALAAGVPLTCLLGGTPRAVRAYNSCGLGLMAPEAAADEAQASLERGRALQDEGVAWLEEPIRHDDLAGNAQLARDLHLPVQLGENFNGAEGMLQALQAGACDLAMPDVARIGGVSGWMQAAGVAQACGIPMSSHLMPEVSAHLLAATPTCHWLEYVDWTDAIAAEPVQIRDGCWTIGDQPGTGLAWDADKVKRYRIP